MLVGFQIMRVLILRYLDFVVWLTLQQVSLFFRGNVRQFFVPLGFGTLRLLLRLLEIDVLLLKLGVFLALGRRGRFVFVPIGGPADLRGPVLQPDVGLLLELALRGQVLRDGLGEV